MWAQLSLGKIYHNYCMLSQYCEATMKSSCSVRSFQLFTQPHKVLKQRKIQSLSSKIKTVKIHGHVCDVYSQKVYVIQSIFKDSLCSLAFSSIRLMSPTNIQVNITFTHTVHWCYESTEMSHCCWSFSSCLEIREEERRSEDLGTHIKVTCCCTCFVIPFKSNLPSGFEQCYTVRYNLTIENGLFSIIKYLKLSNYFDWSMQKQLKGRYVIAKGLNFICLMY